MPDMNGGPTSASNLNADGPSQEWTRDAQRRTIQPLNSLVASAQRITSSHLKDRRGFGKPESWQDDAWDMYDLVGEQRFLATTLAGRLSQAKFYVGKVSEDPIEPPEPLDSDEHIAAQAFSYFGDSPMARAQMVARLGVNLFVAGDGWLVGIPRWMLPGNEDQRPDDLDPFLSLNDLEWRMLSVSEVSQQNEQVILRLGDGREDQIVCEPNDIFLIRVWRPHPRKWWQADSPTRSSLGVLRELVGLTMHISAQVDSRLAGAGILVVPASAKRAIAVAAGIDPDTDEDPFTEALMEAMMTAIQDRSNASALVPLVVTVPDDATGLFQHITFSTALDAEARNLRDEAIRRLALGQDAPPELLLGVGGMNHWGAWLVREDVVTTHIEPPLALICDAITAQFLWPVLIEQGMEEEEAREYVVWYDVSHMVQRPNRLGDANMLHDKGVISDETLREAAGFGNNDAPDTLSEPVRIAIEMAKANPNLVDNMPEIVKAFEDILNPETARETVEEAKDITGTGEDVTEPDSTDPDPDPDRTGAPRSEGEREMPEPRSPGFGQIGSIARQFGVDPEALATWLGAERETGTQPQTFAPQSVDTSTSVGFFLLPENGEDLPGPEEPKHATLLFLGHYDADGAASLQDAEDHLSLLANAAAKRVGPATVPVIDEGSLGDEGAQVWFLDSEHPMWAIRNLLLGDETVKHLYDEGTFTKYPEFKPHVTIGYQTPPKETENSLTAAGGWCAPSESVYSMFGELTDEDVAKAREISEITFDRLALWFGDKQIEFPLIGNADEFAWDESKVKRGEAGTADAGRFLPKDGGSSKSKAKAKPKGGTTGGTQQVGEKPLGPLAMRRKMVREILDALDDVMDQLSSAQARALMKRVEANAKAFLAAGSSPGNKGGDGGGKKGAGSDSDSDSKKRKGSDSGSDSDSGSGKSGGGSGPAGTVEAILKSLEPLLKGFGKNMKAKDRDTLEKAVDELKKLEK